MRVTIQQFHESPPIMVLTYIGDVKHSMSIDDAATVYSTINNQRERIYLIMDVRELKSDVQDVLNFLKTTQYSMMDDADLAHKTYAAAPIFVGSNQLIDLYMERTQERVFGSQSAVFNNVDAALNYIRTQLMP